MQKVPRFKPEHGVNRSNPLRYIAMHQRYFRHRYRVLALSTNTLLIFGFIMNRHITDPV
jgi:hypothetical protein